MIDEVGSSIEVLGWPQVNYPHSAVYLVVMFEKVLQSDIQTVADLYTKGADKEKVNSFSLSCSLSCLFRFYACVCLRVFWHSLLVRFSVSLSLSLFRAHMHDKPALCLH